MKLFDALDDLGFGELHAIRDERTGLRAMVAIHDTRLGPALGGARLRTYASEDDALQDVVRLARAMTYKAALAGLPHGGGKAVILGPAPSSAEARKELLREFGRSVDRLGGRYLTTEDSGTSAADMDVIREVTRYVVGASPDQGGSGDPSGMTAFGVRRGIEACANVVLGVAPGKGLSGLRIAIQGVGHVGYYLARELRTLGAELTISDVDGARASAVAAELAAKVVAPDAIFDVECDIFAPCAYGGAISNDTLPRLRCKIVAGAANNQIASPDVAEKLLAAGITYAPDYAINAGGLINVAQEVIGYDREAARAKSSLIYETIRGILERARREHRMPGEVADKMAEERLTLQATAGRSSAA
jgi:leucine dehydrogenase